MFSPAPGRSHRLRELFQPANPFSQCSDSFFTLPAARSEKKRPGTMCGTFSQTAGAFSGQLTCFLIVLAVFSEEKWAEILKKSHGVFTVLCGQLVG
jgi:hypothetical protein